MAHRDGSTPPAAALRTLLLGAVACACSEPSRPAASAPATTTGSTPSPPASAAITPASQASATEPPASARAPVGEAAPVTAATSSSPSSASVPPAGLPDSCVPARGLRRSRLKGERRDASGVTGCVDAVDGHCCGPAGGGMACARPFDRGTTLRVRSAGHADVCCYAMGGNEICEGRPLYVDGVLRRAALQSRESSRARDDWSRAS